ncbi:helix-turn-helix domain-containing protein [Pontimicrobium sp. SW4]|uniref:Helix-turn-helix domain-containing protein n=1 Tax=Pontimicrobium sp. SW4 TaxID=3153519 RepID=A0AAU7BPI3_9FLAO
MIYISGLSIALFISALLLNKKNRSKSDLFLFIWMLLMALHLYLFYVNFKGSPFKSPYLLSLPDVLPLLHGVFLYYYVSSITNQFPKRNWVAWLHLTPSIIGYMCIILFFKSSTAQRLHLYENDEISYENFMNFGLILIFLSGIIYVAWSSVLLSKHKKKIRNQFSDIEEINLKWLRLLTYGLGVVWCIVIFTNNDQYIFLGVSVFVILIGFFGVQQQTIFSGKKLVLEKFKAESLDNEQKEKYLSSGLGDKLAVKVHNDLIKLFTEDEYYKEMNLSLNDLATKLDIHPNYLSQIINEKEGKNFYDFVNTFRVKEFKRLIKIPENKQYTLLALAYDCGFNSKSSFNRYFKKSTGKTPSQYAKAFVE